MWSAHSCVPRGARTCACHVGTCADARQVVSAVRRRETISCRDAGAGPAARKVSASVSGALLFQGNCACLKFLSQPEGHALKATDAKLSRPCAFQPESAPVLQAYMHFHFRTLSKRDKTRDRGRLHKFNASRLEFSSPNRLVIEGRYRTLAFEVCDIRQEVSF
jgi:hypothetical protein